VNGRSEIERYYCAGRRAVSGRTCSYSGLLVAGLPIRRSADGKILKAVLFVLALSYALVWIAKLSGQAPQTLSLKEIFPLIGLAIPLLESKKATPFYLLPPFKRGVYGGLIGGFIAGLIIGVGYYIRYPTKNLHWSIIPEIVLYASLFV